MTENEMVGWYHRLSEHDFVAVYQQIEQSIQSPQTSGKDYVITKFGAKPDASAAENQKAIQKAIDKPSPAPQHTSAARSHRPSHTTASSSG